MLVRNCAGGVVFSGDRVLLLKDGDGEWILPKGTVQNNNLTCEAVLKKLRDEAGISAEIVSTAGRTNYEFSSVSRAKPICNKITWYILKTLGEKCEANEKGNVSGVGFFALEEAINLVSNNQDKALLSLSYRQFKELA